MRSSVTEMVDSEEISQMWCPFLNYIIKLKKELKCFVCNGLFRIPKLLPCDHIVCSDCIITPVASERSACLSCQNPFRNEDTRHAFHAERMVSLFQEMDAAIGSVIQQRSSRKNAPGDKPSGVHNAQDKPCHSPFSKKVSHAGDEPPGLHNAQDKPSHSLLSKKISLGGDEPSGVHNAQDKPNHLGSHGFPSANYRASKRRVDEGGSEQPETLDKLSVELATARAEIETLRKRLQVQESESERCRAEQQASFFQSPEFFDALAMRSGCMMKHGFEGALRQCVKAGLISRDTDLSFLDLEKVLNELPPLEKADHPYICISEVLIELDECKAELEDVRFRVEGLSSMLKRTRTKLEGASTELQLAEES